MIAIGSPMLFSTASAASCVLCEPSAIRRRTWT